MKHPRIYDPKPMMADGGVPGLSNVLKPHSSRKMQPEHIPKPVFSFSGKPINSRLYYEGK